jgi:hypothetical protein
MRAAHVAAGARAADQRRGRQGHDARDPAQLKGTRPNKKAPATAEILQAA